MFLKKKYRYKDINLKVVGVIGNRRRGRRIKSKVFGKTLSDAKSADTENMLTQNVAEENISSDKMVGKSYCYTISFILLWWIPHYIA